VKPSNCFRRLENLDLPSVFDTSLSRWMIRNLQSYPTTVLNERMWHFRGIKTYSDSSYIFSGRSGPPQLPGSTLLRWCSRLHWLYVIFREHGNLASSLSSSSVASSMTIWTLHNSSCGFSQSYVTIDRHILTLSYGMYNKIDSHRKQIA